MLSHRLDLVGQAPIMSFSLTTKLPFEDDEFDHVHIQAIAKGVPENKVGWSWIILVITNTVSQWGVLFEVGHAFDGKPQVYQISQGSEPCTATRRLG